MNRRPRIALLLLAAGIGLLSASVALAENPSPKAGATASKAPKAKFPPFEQVLGEAQPIDGFIKLYRKNARLFGEISPSELNRDLVVAIAIARGIGQLPLVGGMTWGFNDDWVWQFRKVDDRIQIVRRNVRFRAPGGSPLEKAVHISYTDSILFSLPIVTTSPKGGFVVDLTPVFMSDLPQIGMVLQGFNVDPNRSSWAKVKGFAKNIEIEVAATYASGGRASIDTVPDSRGATLYIHYSISHLPQTGYRPRLADDRVGHFVTVIKDFSKTTGEDQFVRYINRWDLRKSEPSAAVSPPVTPIIFWIEKTVPYKFRGAVREGILDWNKALEKAGFADAIEVRQQPDDATWDPEDINYNTFRWITSSTGFAMGPSHVNPLTGQIFDADIIFDAEFVAFWMKSFDVFKPEVSGKQPKSIRLRGEELANIERFLGEGHQHHGAACNCADEMAEQLAFGSIALAAGGKIIPKEQFEKILVDGVKSVVTHEVGHTLGLRHNFKASTLFTMEELNDPEKTRNVGLAASVMDYVPLNLAPKGKKQGDYFSRTIGPYDYWAIQYAYKTLPGGTEGEKPLLEKIASRGAEPALQYATDEDAADTDPDPLVNRHDLSKDNIEYARWRVELINQLLPGLVDQMVEPGQGYQRVRQALGVMLREHDRAMHYVARYIGGVSVHRNHKGDPHALPPFVVTEAKKQREALAFLEDQVFGPAAYLLPDKLYDYMAPSYWNHWGMPDVPRQDLPIREIVRRAQDHVFEQILSPVTLARLLDSEVKAPPKQEVFTAAELLQGLTASIFRETESLDQGKFTNRVPAIKPLRRDLQGRYFQRLAGLAAGSTTSARAMGPFVVTVTVDVPVDCRNIARAELVALKTRIEKVLSGKAELDSYTHAHLTDLVARIQKVLDSHLEQPKP